MYTRRLARLPTLTLDDGAVVHEATTAAARLLGLALLRSLPEGHALLIPRCRSVHTVGMRFPIDVAFLDDSGRPIRVERGVRPCRVRSCRAAVAVLETRAGELERFLAWPRSVR